MPRCQVNDTWRGTSSQEGSSWSSCPSSHSPLKMLVLGGTFISSLKDANTNSLWSSLLSPDSVRLIFILANGWAVHLLWQRGFVSSQEIPGILSWRSLHPDGQHFLSDSVQASMPHAVETGTEESGGNISCVLYTPHHKFPERYEKLYVYIATKYFPKGYLLSTRWKITIHMRNPRCLLSQGLKLTSDGTSQRHSLLSGSTKKTQYHFCDILAQNT